MPSGGRPVDPLASVPPEKPVSWKPLEFAFMPESSHECDFSSETWPSSWSCERKGPRSASDLSSSSTAAATEAIGFERRPAVGLPGSRSCSARFCEARDFLLTYSSRCCSFSACFFFLVISREYSPGKVNRMRSSRLRFRAVVCLNSSKRSKVFRHAFCFSLLWATFASEKALTMIAKNMFMIMKNTARMKRIMSTAPKKGLES
mmetsp:Transcript_11171/g.25009  ORF Transcript_11171/g.25009 Transcript_11171/m.25009 type:complete len:204 (+) Transcript_11171:397-1008(+)